MLTLPPPPPSSLLACKSRRRSSHLSVRAHAHNAALCTTCLLQTSVPCILNSYAWGEIAIVIGEKQDQATGHNTFAFEIPYLAVVEGKGTASLFFRFAFSSLTISSFTPSLLPFVYTGSRAGARRLYWRLRYRFTLVFALYHVTLRKFVCA